MVIAASESDKPHLLVIDDDPLLTKTLGKVLSKQGYLVETASNGYEGIKKAKSGFFHVILCDIRMPGLDGLMTIRTIQDMQLKAGKEKSAFIVISAYESRTTSRTAKLLGVTDFLQKPFDLNHFLTVVDHNVRPVLQRNALDDVRRLNERLDKLIHAIA